MNNARTGDASARPWRSRYCSCDRWTRKPTDNEASVIKGTERPDNVFPFVQRLQTTAAVALSLGNNRQSQYVVDNNVWACSQNVVAVDAQVGDNDERAGQGNKGGNDSDNNEKNYEEEGEAWLQRKINDE